MSDHWDMHLQQMWHQFLAEQGNAPGLHQGNVTITLLSPVAGIRELTVPSNEVAFAAEAGSLVGLLVTLPASGGKRRLFIGGANVAGIIDTAVEGEKPSVPKKAAASRGKSTAVPA